MARLLGGVLVCDQVANIGEWVSRAEERGEVQGRPPDGGGQNRRDCSEPANSTDRACR